MTVDSNLVPIDPEDSFLLAVEQLAAGEALESVLAGFPTAERDALRELLTIVAATYHLQESDIPRPSAERRAAGKMAFLQAAVAMKTTATAAKATEEATSSTPVAATLAADTSPVISSPIAVAPPRPTVAVPTLGERLGAWWADMVNGILPTTMRLAPLLAMLAAIWFGAFNAVNAAQAAVPGNPVYPAKTWFYAQKLTLSNPEDRPQIYDTYLSVLKEDNARAGQLAVQENAIRRTSAMLLIDGIGRNHIEIGGLLIETSYQKSLAADEMTPMTMNGLPVVGAQAYVEYQIVPDPTGAPGATVLQGISLTIEEEPIIIPTAVPTVITPTVPPTTTTAACVIAAPAGWVTYVVPGGSTISGIAQQTGSTVPELVRVNCIVNSNLVRAGDTLWIPRLPVINMTPTTAPATNPSLEVTLTAISTTQPTPLITVTMPAEGTPTLAITATVIATATTEISTPTPETTSAVTATIVPTTTVTATVVPSHTPTATVVLPTATPPATTVMTGTVVATPEPTAEETADETAEGTAVAPETTPTPPATSETPTGEATAESEPDATATTAVVTTPGSTPTDGSSSDESDSGEIDNASGGDGDAPPAPDSTESPPAVKPTTAPETTGRSDGSRTGPAPTATPTPVNASPLESGG